MKRSDRLYDGHVARGRALAATVEPDELFIHFGHWDEPARAEPSQFRAAQRRLNDRLLALAPPLDGRVVVDVGCGFGGTLATIAATATGARLYGVNIDPRQLAIARTRVRPGANRVWWCAADACALPFAAGSVDVLLAVECVPHFRSRAAFLDEASRVLAPGGLLILSDFVRAGSIEPSLASVIDEGLSPWSMLDAADYPALAQRSSLAIVAREDASQATLPSYATILRDFDALAPLALDRYPAGEERALAALGWLQARGLVRMEYLALVRG